MLPNAAQTRPEKLLVLCRSEAAAKRARLLCQVIARSSHLLIFSTKLAEKKGPCQKKKKKEAEKG